MQQYQSNQQKSNNNNSNNNNNTPDVNPDINSIIYYEVQHPYKTNIKYNFQSEEKMIDWLKKQG